ncbi:MAG: carbohydrate-binding protein, partial [Vicinamibacterales bacterium]
SSGAGGLKMYSADRGWSSTSVPLASPADYFEAPLTVQANTPYRVWLRLRGTNESKYNESVWVQFSGAQDGAGNAVYRIGTTSAMLLNLERCRGCGISSWGWQDRAYWLGAPGPIRFASAGPHTVRVQTREDGVQVDQIVLSPVAYLTSAPGAARDDRTIVPKATTTPTATPFTGTPAVLPGTIQAEAFDNGPEGAAYQDLGAGNSGGAYRTTNVDLEPASGGGYNVGWTSPGEWLQYTVNVQSAGSYVASFRVANAAGGGRFHLEAAGVAVGATMRIPNTGGWQAWQTVTTTVSLQAGVQALRVVFDGPGDIAVGNLDAFTVGTAGPPPPPPSSTGQTITVPAGGDLQAAINQARLGDTILLQPGALYTGAFELPAKSGTGYLTIRSATPDSQLPPDGVRISPADAPRLPRLVSIAGMAVLRTRPGAHHYRLQYLELTSGWEGSNILELGADAQTADQTPGDFIVDHCYLHGDPVRGQKRGIALNSARTTVSNSYIADIKSAESDAQAIAAWNGPGPYTITNNYLEASGENVMFGGSDPTVSGLVPSDITLTGNTVSKQPSWRGQRWTVKNLLELKNAQRVRVDGNVFEYNWAAAQIGYAILLTPRNQDGGAPWTIVRDVQFTNNIVRHVAGGFSILERDYVFPSQPLSQIVVRNNLFEDVSGANWGGQGRFLLAMGGDQITFDHNTIFSDGASVVYADDRPTRGFTFTNNILRNTTWAIMGSNASQGLGTLAMYFPQAVFLGNIVAGAPAWMYPTGNFYPASLSDVGFVNLAGGDYRLSDTSPYRNAGTDGTDVGVRLTSLNAALGSLSR